MQVRFLPGTPLLNTSKNAIIRGYFCAYMREKLKEKIKNSGSLDAKQRKLYLKLVDYLPEARLVELEAILTKEKQDIDALAEKNKMAKSEINKKYIQAMRETVKKSEKEAIGKEEAADQAEGDAILKQLEALE